MSSRVSLSIGLPTSVPSLPRRSVSFLPIMPAAPVMRICTSSLLPEAVGRSQIMAPFGGRVPIHALLTRRLQLAHGIQLAQACPLSSSRVEVLGREPALEGSLARRPFAIEHRVIGGVAAALLADHVETQNALEHESIAHGGPTRGCVERIALPFVAPIAERLEDVAREQILRLGSKRRALQRRRI